MPNPDFIPIPFAENGLKNPIQKQLQPNQDPESATWDKGWPQITMVPKEDGGLAPKGQDFNGVLNTLSQHAIHRQNGEQVKFSQEVAAEFGGYAMGAIVQSDDGLRHYRSLINNNTFNPNTQSIANRWQIYIGLGSVPAATSTTAGITKVLNALNSTDSGSALSAAQGKALNDKMLGVGQTWQNMASARVVGGTYTNNTGRPIQVLLTITNSSTSQQASFQVGSVVVAILRDGEGERIQLSVIIPNGSTYKLNGPCDIVIWAELR